MPRAIATTDHQTIRKWVEARNGHPSVVKSTQSDESGQGGLLRIDFNKPEESLGEVSWDEFFETFDENGLAFLYQDKTTSGRKSRFNKFVRRDAVDTQDTEEDSDDRGSSRSASSSQSSQRASQMQDEAEEADEDDALEEDEDFDEDFDEDEEEDEEDEEEDEDEDEDK
jgi:hypothetical protein